MRIAILGCKASKQDYECPADEMYSKSWVYRAQRDFISRVYNAYFIFSSEYGVIEPTCVIKPYNTTLYGKMTIKQAPQADSLIILQAAKTINEMEGEIDLHMSNTYYSKLKPHLTREVNHIKQQVTFGSTKEVYTEALQMWNGGNLDQCSAHLQTKKPSKYNEQSKWFVHPELGEFYGKATQLKKAYPDLDLGNTYQMSTGRTKSHKGWSIKRDYLKES